MTLDPKEIPVSKLHKYLLGSVGPRPIAFASTIDLNGNKNLAPFSFFNVFSANPPILVFSPARSGRTNTTKDTYNNVKAVAEVVINIVNYNMVQQMSLASTAYDSEVDEFVKSGLTAIKSETVKPYRVKESPVQFECKVLEVNELGSGGGAGNLVICEVLKIHIHEEVLNKENLIDQHKIDLVARMGGNWYCRANDSSMFEINKPITKIGIGIDQLPIEIRNSELLNGNQLGILGNLETIPTENEIDNELVNYSKSDFTLDKANELLHMNKPIAAYGVLLKVLS